MVSPPGERDAAILGPGRLGTLLAAALTRSGWRVRAVGGGQPEARARLAQLVAGARPCDDVVEAARRGRLVVLAVPDDALEPLARELALAGAVGEGRRVVHVAGSRGLEVLSAAARAGAGTAGCHPAMTVPAGSTDPDLLLGVAWAVSARSADRGWAHALVTDLGGEPTDLRDDVRGLYHAGLAVGSNTVGAAVVLARRLLLAAGIEDPAAFLGPLVRASAANALEHGAAALTGPVVRGDVGTVRTHLDALERDLPELADAYRSLSQVLLTQVAPGLPADQHALLAALLSPSVDTPS